MAIGVRKEKGEKGGDRGKEEEGEKVERGIRKGRGEKWR